MLTALMVAAHWKHRACVRSLLAAGATVDARDDQGWIALHHGAWGGDIEVLRLLLDARADIDATQEEGVSALWCCHAKEHVSAAKFLYLEDEDDMPLFWFAIAQAQWECAELQPSVLAKVARLVAAGRGLVGWQEADEATVKERQRVLTEFLTQLQQINPTP